MEASFCPAHAGEAKPVSAMDSESEGTLHRFVLAVATHEVVAEGHPRLGGGAVAELVKRLDGLDEGVLKQVKL